MWLTKAHTSQESPTSTSGSSSLRIPTTYLFLDILNFGLAGAWIVMTIDLFIRSSLSFYIFKRGKWKYLQV